MLIENKILVIKENNPVIICWINSPTQKVLSVSPSYVRFKGILLPSFKWADLSLEKWSTLVIVFYLFDHNDLDHSAIIKRTLVKIFILIFLNL